MMAVKARKISFRYPLSADSIRYPDTGRFSRCSTGSRT
jgi:hypothetical protein